MNDEKKYMPPMQPPPRRKVEADWMDRREGRQYPPKPAMVPKAKPNIQPKHMNVQEIILDDYEPRKPKQKPIWSDHFDGQKEPRPIKSAGPILYTMGFATVAILTSAIVALVTKKNNSDTPAEPKPKQTQRTSSVPAK
jgi:hypothetical protein